MLKHAPIALAFVALAIWLFAEMGSRMGLNLLAFAGVMVLLAIYLLFVEGKEE